MTPAEVRNTREPFECACGNTVKDGDIYITLETRFFVRNEAGEDRYIGGGGPATEHEIHAVACAKCINYILEVTKNAITKLTRAAPVESSDNTSAESSPTLSGQPVSDNPGASAHESTI